MHLLSSNRIYAWGFFGEGHMRIFSLPCFSSAFVLGTTFVPPGCRRDHRGKQGHRRSVAGAFGIFCHSRSWWDVPGCVPSCPSTLDMPSNGCKWQIIPYGIITACSKCSFFKRRTRRKDERIKPGTHCAVQDEQGEKKSTWLRHPLGDPDTTGLWSVCLSPNLVSQSDAAQPLHPSSRLSRMPLI